jgi:hypothetical protein
MSESPKNSKSPAAKRSSEARKLQLFKSPTKVENCDLVVVVHGNYVSPQHHRNAPANRPPRGASEPRQLSAHSSQGNNGPKERTHPSSQSQASQQPSLNAGRQERGDTRAPPANSSFYRSAERQRANSRQNQRDSLRSSSSGNHRDGWRANYYPNSRFQDDEDQELYSSSSCSRDSHEVARRHGDGSHQGTRGRSQGYHQGRYWGRDDPPLENIQEDIGDVQDTKADDVDMGFRD